MLLNVIYDIYSLRKILVKHTYLKDSRIIMFPQYFSLACVWTVVRKSE